MPVKPVRSKKDFENRFLVELNSGCWLWLGCTDRCGYGRLVIEGKTNQAHRVAYELWRGEIPHNQILCHSCDVRSCVNPDHLFAGTKADNNRDMILKDRHNRGERNGHAVLSEADVLEIRSSSVSNRRLAAQYGVSHNTIGRIKRGLSWSHLGPFT